MRNNRRRLAAAVAVGAVLVAAGCGTPGDSDQAAQGGSQPATQQDSEGGQADGADGADPADDQDGAETSDIPDPVAEVNGTPIGRSEFVNVLRGQQQQAQLSGARVDEGELRDQALEGLIGVELLQQEATRRGIDVTEGEVDQALKGFAATNQVSTDEFVATMGEQGMDRAGVLDQIRKQLRVEKLVAREYGEYQPSEQEIRAAYDQVARQQATAGAQGAAGGAGQVPPLEQVRDQVAQQLTAEHQARSMQEFSEKLRGDARVDVHL